MKKYLYLLLFVFSFSYGQVFSNIKDTAVQINQTYTDNHIYSVSNPFSQSQFVPDIALIFDFSYVRRNVSDETYKQLSIPGFLHELYHAHGEHEHKPMNFERGFNLNYGELSIGSTVDPYFDLFATFHLSENNFEIEELFFNTCSLPYSFQIKAGKFRSSIGRVNSQHQHVWDFADIPLVYKVFFGEHSLNEKGVQITWLAPAEFYLLFGAEALQGENEQSFGYEAIDTFNIPSAEKPNVYTAFIKTSYDIGNLTLLGGLSFITGKTRVDHTEDENPHAFAGDTEIYGLDLTGKYFLDSYRYISVQGEYFYRDIDGTKYENPSNPVSEKLHKKQSGYYIQLVHRFSQRWRYGFRYDSLNKNDINSISQSDNLDRYSFMLEFNTSEFARLRFQYSYDRSKFLEGKRKSINEFIVEFNMAIGAHGAHPF
ncbi:MAG: hypothetical protein Q9M89_09360 [Persephonella sp.]|nr:hypothetical protein [Persephonella sp.]